MEKKVRLLKEVEAGSIGIEKAFELWAKDGICPALLNDDFGNWAVVFDGYQQIPETPGEPADIDMSFFPRKEYWEKSIKQALINAIKRD